jgi:hypothetical protein
LRQETSAHARATPVIHRFMRSRLLQRRSNSVRSGV